MISLKRILSPIDFSEFSLNALEAAKDVARRYGSEILLIHVVPEIPKLPETVSLLKEGEYERQLIETAKKRLDELAENLRREGIRASSSVGVANDTAMEIIRVAESENVDLILIATHGMTGWRRLAFGSVTDKVVRTADCPVLVLPRKAAAAGASASV
jgi:nucleotide-binding universal stress UspA family protein